MIAKIKEKLNSYQIIAIIYVLIVLLGTLLLAMPISSKTGEFTPFIDSLFTATSATCVTGLVIYDTFTHWSLFGQLVILFLIQIGGIGFMTVMSLFLMAFKRQITLHEKTLFVQATGNNPIGSTLKLVKQVALGTAVFETTGALLLSISFIPKLGWGKGIYAAIFHSISAFCNAGFDIMGSFGEFSSFSAFSGDWLVTLTVSALIVMGGIGFVVWNDVIKNRFKWKTLALHTKIVISCTSLLIVSGTLLFLLFEFNHSLRGMSGGEKFLNSLFLAVTPRTAGFNIVKLTELSEGGSIITMLLMIIGGSSGSTAGGIKTTTFVVLILTISAYIKRKHTITIGKRRLEDSVIPHAAALVSLYASAILLGSLIICLMQPYTIKEVLFEVISAIGTVGLSLGITPSLNVISKIVITLLMFCGRVGMLTVSMLFSSKRTNVPLERPAEKINIG